MDDLGGTPILGNHHNVIGQLFSHATGQPAQNPVSTVFPPAYHPRENPVSSHIILWYSLIFPTHTTVSVDWIIVTPDSWCMLRKIHIKTQYFDNSPCFIFQFFWRFPQPPTPTHGIHWHPWHRNSVTSARSSQCITTWLRYAVHSSRRAACPVAGSAGSSRRVKTNCTWWGDVGNLTKATYEYLWT